MGRPAKYNETMLIERLDEYFVHVGGNVNVLTFKAVSDYAKEQGYDVPEHVFRRYGNVLAHFQDLSQCRKLYHRAIRFFFRLASLSIVSPLMEMAASTVSLPSSNNSGCSFSNRFRSRSTFLGSSSGAV